MLRTIVLLLTTILTSCTTSTYVVQVDIDNDIIEIECKKMINSNEFTGCSFNGRGGYTLYFSNELPVRYFKVLGR